MDYVWLNGRIVEVIANGAVSSIATDQTGRPLALKRRISIANAAVQWQAQGLPFQENVTINQWAAGNFNIGFPGQYHDSEDGLWYNGARDYDATLGRFIESDPIGLEGGVNTYAYVGNNPLSYIDPLGLCCSKTQQAAADAAEKLAKLSDASGNVEMGAEGVAAGSAIYGGFVGEADLPVTVGSAEVAETAGSISSGAGLLSAGLNTYASGGNFGYFLKFGLDFSIKRINGSVLSHVPGMDNLAKFYSDLSTKLLGSLIPDGMPCGAQ
jgi:RHS repeat-associated protein